MDMQGRPVAVITGASSGIGRATALQFAHSGYDVVLAARDEDALYALQGEIERTSAGAALAMPTDVTMEGQVEALAQEAVNRFGRIDVWVNDAAVGIFGRFDEIPTEEFRRAVETDMWGYVYGARAAIRRFKEQGAGTLVNVASIDGKVGAPWATPYAMSKAAIIALSDSLREELADEPHIHVSVLMPATIDTPFFQHAATFLGRPAKAMAPVYPAEDVAKEILKLARKPKAEAYVGQTPWHLRFLHAHLKAPFMKLWPAQVWKGQFAESAAPRDAGGLYEPSGIHDVSGGWTHHLGGRRGRAMVGALIGVVAGAGLLAWRRRAMVRALPPC